MTRYNLFPSPTYSSLSILFPAPPVPPSLGLRDTKNWSRLLLYTTLIGSKELIGQIIDHMSPGSILRPHTGQRYRSVQLPTEVSNVNHLPPHKMIPTRTRSCYRIRDIHSRLRRKKMKLHDMFELAADKRAGSFMFLLVSHVEGARHRGLTKKNFHHRPTYISTRSKHVFRALRSVIFDVLFT